MWDIVSVVFNSLWPTDFHGILQARMLECVAFPFSRGSSQPRDRTLVSRTTDGFFTSWATREAPHGILLSHKERIWFSSRDVAEPRASQTEWRSQENKYCIWCVYMVSRKLVLMNRFSGQEYRPGSRGGACGLRRGRTGWDKLREQHGSTDMTMCKMHSDAQLRVTGSLSWWAVMTQRGGGWRDGG